MARHAVLIGLFLVPVAVTAELEAAQSPQGKAAHLALPNAGFRVNRVRTGRGDAMWVSLSGLRREGFDGQVNPRCDDGAGDWVIVEDVAVFDEAFAALLSGEIVTAHLESPIAAGGRCRLAHVTAGK